MTCLKKVQSLMSNGKFHALAALAKQTGYGEPTISARLRQLRAQGYTLERKRDNRARGFSYRLSLDRSPFKPEGKRKCICAYCHGRGFKYGGIKIV